MAEEREPLYASRPVLGSGIEPGPGVDLLNVTEQYVPVAEAYRYRLENEGLAAERDRCRTTLAALTDAVGSATVVQRVEGGPIRLTPEDWQRIENAAVAAREALDG
jgi:hypothetical protein